MISDHGWVYSMPGLILFVTFGVMAIYAIATREPHEPNGLIWFFTSASLLGILVFIWFANKYVVLTVSGANNEISQTRRTLFSDRSMVFAIEDCQLARCQVRSSKAIVGQGKGLVLLLGQKCEPFLLMSAATQAAVESYIDSVPVVLRRRLVDNQWTVYVDGFGFGW